MTAGGMHGMGDHDDGSPDSYELPDENPGYEVLSDEVPRVEEPSALQAPALNRFPRHSGGEGRLAIAQGHVSGELDERGLHGRDGRDVPGTGAFARDGSKEERFGGAGSRKGGKGASGKAPLIVLIVALVLALGIEWWFLGGRDYVTKKVVEKEVTSQLDAVKAGDVSKVVSGVGDSVTFFDEYSVDKTAFFQAYFDGFDYTLDDVVVKGDYIDIQLTVNVKDVSSVYDDVIAKLFTLSTLGSFFHPNDSNLKADIGAAVLEGVSDCDTYMTKTVHVRLIKENGEWTVDNMPEIITQMLTGDSVGTQVEDMLNAIIDGLSQASSSVGSGVGNIVDTITGSNS